MLLTPDDRTVPETCVLADLDVAHDGGRGRDEAATNGRLPPELNGSGAAHHCLRERATEKQTTIDNKRLVRFSEYDFVRSLLSRQPDRQSGILTSIVVRVDLEGRAEIIDALS